MLAKKSPPLPLWVQVLGHSSTSYTLLSNPVRHGSLLSPVASQQFGMVQTMRIQQQVVSTKFGPCRRSKKGNRASKHAPWVKGWAKTPQETVGPYENWLIKHGLANFVHLQWCAKSSRCFPLSENQVLVLKLTSACNAGFSTATACSAWVFPSLDLACLRLLTWFWVDPIEMFIAQLRQTNAIRRYGRTFQENNSDSSKGAPTARKASFLR